MFAGRPVNGSLHRALVQFDFSAIPASSIIESVSLRLHMSRTPGNAQPVELRRVSTNWGEGTSDAGTRSGGGAAATPGDATWIHHHFDTGNWLTPGGDFSPVLSATAMVDGVGFYEWLTAPQLVADVQDWVDNPSANFGWMLLGKESESGTVKRFDTHETSTAANRPQLTVTYTVVPEPGAGLLAFGFATVLLSRHRRWSRKRM